jgi:hypothetical protein
VPTTDKSKFKNLQGFAHFLLEKKKVKQLAQTSLELAKQHDLIYIKHSTDKELIAFLQSSLKKLLEDIKENKVLEGSLANLSNWVNNEIKNLPDIKIGSSEISKAYKIRKKSLEKFIPEYTNEPMLKTVLQEEISSLMMILEKTAIGFSKARK